MHLVSHKDIMKGLLKHPQGCTAIIKRCCCVINKLGGTSCKTHEQEHKSCQSTASTAKGRPKLTLHRSRSGLQSMQDTEALRKLDGKRQAELLLLQHCYDSFLHTSSFGNCKRKFIYYKWHPYTMTGRCAAVSCEALSVALAASVSAALEVAGTCPTPTSTLCIP